jgi:hypothetical protein
MPGRMHSHTTTKAAFMCSQHIKSKHTEWCMASRQHTMPSTQYSAHLIVNLQVAGAHKVLGCAWLRVVLNGSKDVLNAAATQHTQAC